MFDFQVHFFLSGRILKYVGRSSLPFQIILNLQNQVLQMLNQKPYVHRYTVSKKLENKYNKVQDYSQRNVQLVNLQIVKEKKSLKRNMRHAVLSSAS